jgi:DNA-binding SARP family transcriptional activator/tetratricopeptide (TPR) repeat protein
MIRAPVSLKVITLGRFAILRDQNLLSGGNWKHRRVRELFKLLLSAEQHRLHREQVQELLWPSFSIEQAANSFGKTLYLLRRALEPDLATGKPSTYVSLEHDTVFLVPDSMEIDADRFESMAKHIQVNTHSGPIKEQQLHITLEAFDNALALYGGDYLPDDLYEDWAQRRRDRLQRTYSWLLEHAAKIAIAGSQGQRACEYLRALLEYNHADEQTHRQLMLLYARMGRRSDALNQYHLLRTALREELRANPLPETIELYRAIQGGRIPADLTETLSPTLHTHPHSISDEHTYTSETHTATLSRPEVSQGTESESVTILSRLKPDRILKTKLVGRVEELQDLQQAYTSVSKGQMRVFFVNGEAGIGKTRLAREFSTWAEEQQATVLWGNCYEMSGTLPYQPIIDMLTAHIRLVSSEQLRSMLGSGAVDLAKLVPALRTKLPDPPPPEPLGAEVERRNLYNAVASYFSAIASEHPAVLILDDLQWADTATMQLLSYLFVQSANQAAQGSVIPFFVLLYRADEVHETHPLRSLLSAEMRAGHAQEMRLRRLKEDEVQQLLIHMAGHDVRASFSEAIYKYTEGNPFFIGESLRALVEEGKIKKVGDRWQTTVAIEELALPQSVRLVIERRLAHLSPECRVTLAYAALLGRQFNSALLCRARNLSEESIAEHVDDAMRTQILTALDDNTGGTGKEHAASQDADLMFTHDKIREVLALWLNPLRRKTAHRQIAQAIETRYASRLQVYYSKLAYHYQMTEETAKAVEYLQKAAVQAASVYAFVEAADFMEKAVELSLGEENRSQRAELLRKLSIEAYLYIGRPDKAIEAGIAACTLWQDIGNPVKEAESCLDVAFSFHWMGRELEAIKYIQRALACLARAPEQTLLLAKAHVQWGLSATISGNIAVALEELQFADELHAQIGGNDPFISVVSLWTRSWCAFATGTLQQMLDCALQSAELCRATRMFAWEPMMTYSAAWALMLMGRLEEGAQVARDTLEKAQRHNAVGAQGWAHLVLSFISIQQGQWDAAEHFADKAAAIATRMHETSLLARSFWGRSICAGWQNDWERAIEHSLEAIQISLRDGELSLIHPYLLLQASKAHFHAGKIEGAQHYLDQSIQLAQEHHYRQLPAIGHRLQGRILQAQGQFDLAQSYFEQSLEELATLNDKVEYARTQQAYGLFFCARNQVGDQERGSALLQQANTMFGELGVNG